MVSQLVVRDTGAGLDLFIEPNRKGLRPLQFEERSHGQSVPRLGTQELVRLAAVAVKRGMLIERFEFFDRSYRRVAPDLEDDLSNDLKEALKRGGGAEALSLLDGELLDYEVVGVKILDPAYRAFTVRRHGVLLAEPDTDPASLLRSAMPDLS